MRPVSFSFLILQYFTRLFFPAILLTLLSGCGGTTSSTIDQPAQKSLLSVKAALATNPLIVTGLQYVSEKRISRTVFEYTYRVNIKNTGSADAAGVNAILTKAPTGTDIIDGAVAAGTIGAGQTATPTDVIILKQDRTVAFNAADLVWQISSANVMQLAPVKPAEVVVLSLKDLGIAGNAPTVTASGAVTDALLKDGTLRFSTPGDTGADQFAEFVVASGTNTTRLQLLIRSVRPTEVVTQIEPFDDGSLPGAVPALIITGLGPNNSFTGSPLKFKLAGSALLDLKDDSDGLILTAGKQSVNLKNYWVFNAADTSFSISGPVLQNLLNVLPAGSLNVIMNFVSKDKEFASVYEFLAVKQSANLSGKFVTPEGANVDSLTTRKVLLKGFNSDLRRVVPVDANGTFSFEGVIPDTYQLTLNDLDNPNVVSASTAVFAGSTQVKVSIVYALGATSSAVSIKSSRVKGTFAGNSVTQDGAPPPAHPVPPQAPAATVMPSIKAAGSPGGTFTAASAAQNQTVTTPIAYLIPAGTKNVAVKITVSTAEYPTYTTTQSQYNDTWSYAVSGLPNTALAASGSVNQSHYTQGTVTKTTCVDVTEQAKNAALSITGAVSATNIGDSILTTTTSVEFSAPCIGLKVSTAKFASPNANGNPILAPIAPQGNLAGTYFSTPLSAADPTHKMPLEITYTPADAQITEVNIGISAPGMDPIFSSDNVLGQTNTITPGKIVLPSLSLPAFATAKANGKKIFQRRERDHSRRDPLDASSKSEA